jgi:hypothetical protein
LNDLESKSYTILKNGEHKMILLPYFVNNSDLIDDYLELYVIEKNKKKLKAEFKESFKSGKSDLVI